MVAQPPAPIHHIPPRLFEICQLVNEASTCIYRKSNNNSGTTNCDDCVAAIAILNHCLRLMLDWGQERDATDEAAEDSKDTTTGFATKNATTESIEPQQRDGHRERDQHDCYAPLPSDNEVVGGGGGGRAPPLVWLDMDFVVENDDGIATGTSRNPNRQKHHSQWRFCHRPLFVFASASSNQINDERGTTSTQFLEALLPPQLGRTVAEEFNHQLLLYAIMFNMGLATQYLATTSSNEHGNVSSLLSSSALHLYIESQQRSMLFNRMYPMQTVAVTINVAQLHQTLGHTDEALKCYSHALSVLSCLRKIAMETNSTKLRGEVRGRSSHEEANNEESNPSTTQHNTTTMTLHDEFYQLAVDGFRNVGGNLSASAA